MSRDEALANLANVLEEHYPHPVFGCECVIPSLEDFPDEGVDPLDESWGTHLAKIAMEACKGF